MTGKFAISKAGHDKTVASPKKKSIRHIQIINETVDEKLYAAIKKNETHIDVNIKYAIKNKLNSK